MRTDNSEIVVAKDSAELSYQAAELLVGCIFETLSRKERFSMALSGGSTPKTLYSLLVEDDYFKNTHRKLTERVNLVSNFRTERL